MVQRDYSVSSLSLLDVRDKEREREKREIELYNNISSKKSDKHMKFNNFKNIFCLTTGCRMADVQCKC